MDGLAKVRHMLCERLMGFGEAGGVGGAQSDV